MSSLGIYEYFSQFPIGHKIHALEIPLEVDWCYNDLIEQQEWIAFEEGYEHPDDEKDDLDTVVTYIWRIKDKKMNVEISYPNITFEEIEDGGVFRLDGGNPSDFYI